MKFFVIVPILILGASAMDIQLSAPQGMNDISGQKIPVIEKIILEKPAAMPVSDVQDKISELDKAARLSRALSASV